MSTRSPLPLRLLQSPWQGSRPSGAGQQPRLFAVHKPAGLPLLTPLQVQAKGAASPASLFDIHSAPTTTDDAADSLLSRLQEASPPGASPYVVFPSISSLTLHAASRRTTGVGGDGITHHTLADVNSWTCRNKGLTLVSRTQEDAFLLRNCAQLGLVQRTYHVVCELPTGVAQSVRAYLGQPTRHAPRSATAPTHSHLHSYISRQQQRTGRHSTDDGIPLSNVKVHRRTQERCSFLHGVPPLDIRRRRLFLRGTFTGRLAIASSSMSPTQREAVQKNQRFHALFGPSATTSNGTANLCNDEDIQHPWMLPVDQLQLTTSASELPGPSRSTRHSHERDITLRHELLAFSSSMDRALFEIAVDGMTTADEIAAIFAEMGCPVVHDYVNNVELARHVESVASVMRQAPPRLLSGAPIRVQQRLQHETAEQLVVFPLLQHPLDYASRCALKYLLELKSSEHNVGNLHDEFFKAVQYNLDSLRGLSSQPLQKLLFQTLSTGVEASTQSAVAALSMGPCIECVAQRYPNPSLERNVRLIQQFAMREEQLGAGAIDEHRKQLMEKLEFSMHSSLGAATGHRGSLSQHSVWLRSLKEQQEAPSVEENSTEIIHQEHPSFHGTIECSFSLAASLHHGRLASFLPHVESAVSSLVPQPYQALFDEWMRSALALENATDTKSQSLPTFLRAEELGEVVCSMCGSNQHSWHVCTKSHERTPTLAPLKLVEATPQPLEDEMRVTASDAATDVTTSDLVRSVDAARDAMLAHDSAALSSTMEDTVISIPNAAPSVAFNPHAHRHERSKPHMQRRSMRCAYCSGHHHITSCPKIGSNAMDSNSSDPSQSFCIKCGERGHVWGYCPKIPDGLHPATHCPICAQPHHKIRHEPSSCPRRVRVPTGFTLDGVVDRTSNVSAHLSHKLPPRKRSMLMADSFVDQRR